MADICSCTLWTCAADLEAVISESLLLISHVRISDELHVWACRVMQQAGVGKDTFLTYDPGASKSGLLSYDLLASALIVVTLKVLFKLDDQQEWLVTVSRFLYSGCSVYRCLIYLCVLPISGCFSPPILTSGVYPIVLMMKTSKIKVNFLKISLFKTMLVNCK